MSFETIEQKAGPGAGKEYESSDLRIMVITKPEEIGDLNGWVSDAAISELNMLEYKPSFAIVVFQGRKPTDRYSVQIERITRSGDKVRVFIKLLEPPQDQAKNDIITSPYHLVSVQKTDSWAQNVTFEVVDSLTNTVIASTISYVP
ncbi:MAG: protease complex subunit PrcB family protein [Chloroflexota bacterium]